MRLNITCLVKGAHRAATIEAKLKLVPGGEQVNVQKTTLSLKADCSKMGDGVIIRGFRMDTFAGFPVAVAAVENHLIAGEEIRDITILLSKADIKTVLERAPPDGG